MTPRTNAKPNAKVPESPAPPSNAYSPSVPISLYREVTTELQSAKTQMESLRLQNQELVQQNQQLRLEIERVVQSALQLRQIADLQHSVSLPPSESPVPNVEVYFETPPAFHAQPEPPEVAKSNPPELPISEKAVFTEQQLQPRQKMDSSRSSGMGNWWLVLVIIAIVVTAFGTGFLIVRPLLPSR
jgi:hypothetical protein